MTRGDAIANVARSCQCEVCRRNERLLAIIEGARLSRQERGELMDAAFDLWEARHAPELATHEAPGGR